MVVSAVLYIVLTASPIQDKLPAWVDEPWDSPKDRGVYEEFRLKCEDLKWGLSKPVVQPDLEKIDDLIKQVVAEHLSKPTSDSLFKVTCLSAHFGNRGPIRQLPLNAELYKASNYRSYEFARVAYVSSVLSLQPLDSPALTARLLQKRKDDPLVLTALIQAADFALGLQPQHKKAIEYAEQLMAMFPDRKARYRAVLLLTVKRYWQRSKDDAYYDRAMRLVDEILADQNSTDLERMSAKDTKRFMIELKKKGGGSLTISRTNRAS